MNKLLFAAPASGSGKTTVVCAVLAALKRRGLDVRALKCGPDYIDPMFHRSVLGVPCRNVDLYLIPEARASELFLRYSEGAEAVIAEGVMGYYDGVGGITPMASAWHVAHTLGFSTVLVVKPADEPEVLVSLVQDYLEVPSTASAVTGGEPADSHICGLFLNHCSGEQYAEWKPFLEMETGLPVVGYLPHLEGAVLESRHLGLKTAGELEDLENTLELLAKTAEETIDLNLLLRLSAGGEIVERSETTEAGRGAKPVNRPLIAVARDRAFNFCYEETIEAFEEAGADVSFFSPLSDEHLPNNISGLYLPGGYPELYAKELSENESMKADIRNAVAGNLPTIAECGGFLYLGQSLETPEGDVFSMAGALPGEGVKTGKLQRFGYAELVSSEDTLLAPANTPVRMHNFHYWDSTERGCTYHATKPVSHREYDTGFGTKTLYAGFPHFYFAGNPELVRRFVNAARDYQK